MRIGGAIFEDYSTPEEWASAVQRQGYSAAYCPIGEDADDDAVGEWEAAAAQAHIVIAEVGAWGNNPISPDDEVRRAGIEGCCRRLDLADRIGANCCVNVSGSRGERWAAPGDGNLTEDTFALIVDSVREIIDTVRPTRNYYALETMPWLYPDSARSYADLIAAIDRERFAVHLDPVNLVNSPERYYNSGAMIEECFRLLGPHIRSCHAKDIILQDELTLHLSECRPGTGGLDWRTYVRELGRLSEDTPLMIEHLSDAREYRAAAAHIRNMAQVERVTVV
ncbi:MAG: sugar phosphate isomerase/epimerase family protein [Armatimonadota bacterium]|jgi:sugar phosphate isomerase/epimerase